MFRVLASDNPEDAYRHDYHGHPPYGRVFFALLSVFCLTLLPNILDFFAGRQIVVLSLTLVSAIFALSALKAYLVVRNFMHVRFEPKAVILFFLFSVLVLFVGFLGIMPDITWVVDPNSTLTAGMSGDAPFVMDFVRVKTLLGYS